MSAHEPARILIVEDDHARCLWFKQKFADYAQDVTCDVKEALLWLALREYVMILLDHDLLDEHYLSPVPDDERTGYAIAAWLAANPHCQMEATILIHSLNYIGAQRMLDTLQNAGRDAEHIPFYYLQAGLRM